MEKKSEKELAIERLIRKVKLVADNCNTLTYDIRLCNLQGEELHRIKDCNLKDMTQENKLELLEKSIVDSIEMYPNAYSVTGVIGPYNNKKNLTNIREVVNPELVTRKVESEDDDNVMIPAPPIGSIGNQHRTAGVSSVMGTDYSQMTTDSYKLLCGIFGMGGLDGVSEPSDMKMQVAMKIQEFKMKSDMQIEKLNGINESNKTTIAELKAKLSVLEQKCGKLERDNERQKKYIESMRPKVEEAKKLSTKNGQIASIGSAVLSGVAMTLLQNSQWGGLLGLGQQEQQQQQQPNPEPQYQEDPVESVDGESFEPSVEQLD